MVWVMHFKLFKLSVIQLQVTLIPSIIIYLTAFIALGWNYQSSLYQKIDRGKKRFSMPAHYFTVIAIASNMGAVCGSMIL